MSGGQGNQEPRTRNQELRWTLDGSAHSGQVSHVITSTISETKNRLSELLRRVQGGETLVILDRNRPVARVDALLDEEFNPYVVPPKDPKGLKRVLDLPIGGRRGRPTGALEALLEERRDGR